ncbi:MAG TPA: hypothetical protein VL688_03385 [Verrucomicrobiae bacterium]|jgi:hypothetical protein|nr:hypothetical protein [Verrucomicrobiae bacterium]
MATKLLVSTDLLTARGLKKHPVKLTALLYLREALLQEKYEDCADCIEIASHFGARHFEIRNILEDPRRMPVL